MKLAPEMGIRPNAIGALIAFAPLLGGCLFLWLFAVFSYISREGANYTAVFVFLILHLAIILFVFYFRKYKPVRYILFCIATLLVLFSLPVTFFGFVAGGLQSTIAGFMIADEVKKTGYATKKFWFDIALTLALLPLAFGLLFSVAAYQQSGSLVSALTLLPAFVGIFTIPTLVSSFVLRRLVLWFGWMPEHEDTALRR